MMGLSIHKRSQKRLGQINCETVPSISSQLPPHNPKGVIPWHWVSHISGRLHPIYSIARMCKGIIDTFNEQLTGRPGQLLVKRINNSFDIILVPIGRVRINGLYKCDGRIGEWNEPTQLRNLQFNWSSVVFMIYFVYVLKVHTTCAITYSVSSFPFNNAWQ